MRPMIYILTFVLCLFSPPALAKEPPPSLPTFKELAAQEKTRKDKLRKGEFYKILKKADKEHGFPSIEALLGKTLKLKENTFTAKKLFAENLSQSIAFLEDKIFDLHNQKDIEPLYYARHSSLNMLYIFSTPNTTQTKALKKKVVTRFYQFLILSQEDIARCKYPKHAEEALKELTEKQIKFFSSFLKKVDTIEKHMIKRAILKVSNGAKERTPNAQPCKGSPEYTSRMKDTKEYTGYVKENEKITIMTAKEAAAKGKEITPLTSPMEPEYIPHKEWLKRREKIRNNISEEFTK